MRPLLNIVLSLLLVFGEAPLLFAADSSLHQKVADKVQLTPQQVYQRFEDRVNLFLGEDDDEDAETDDAPLSPADQKLYKQELEKLVQEIYKDWETLSKMPQYKQDANRLWLAFSVLLLQQDDWLDFFGGQQNFRKKWFPPLANFYAQTVNNNLITADSQNTGGDLEQRLYDSGLALQNLAALHAQGYLIKKSYWEKLAPKAALSLQSGLVVELVFPILIQNKSWNALDKAMTLATQQEWDGRSSAFWDNVSTALSGFGLIGVPSLIKQKINNFNANQDRVFGSVSRLGNAGWRLSSVKYAPTTAYAWYHIHLEGHYRRKTSDFVVLTETNSVLGRDYIPCRPNADGTPNHVSLAGTKVYVFNEKNLQELIARKKAEPWLSKEDGTPLSKTKYAQYSQEIMEIISKRTGIGTSVNLAEVVVTGGNNKTKSVSTQTDGETVPSVEFSSSWMDFAALLETQNPKLLAKHTADLFDKDGEPKTSAVMWPLVLGYLLNAKRDAREGSKPFNMARYFARKTWADIDVNMEQDLDFRLTYRYPQLACYASRHTQESDGSRQYIMVTPDRVRSAIGARWSAVVINDLKPLANAIDWTLIAVSVPTLAKSGVRLAANSGRLLVGRPAVLKSGQMISRSRLLLLSRAKLNRIVRQTSASVQKSAQNLRHTAKQTAARASKTVKSKTPAVSQPAAAPTNARAGKSGVPAQTPAAADIPSTTPSGAAPEAVSSVPEAQIRTSLEGPLAEKVTIPRPVRFGERSLMPTSKTKVPQGWTRESDLVYMEQHATDPNKVVMYYTDDAGRAVTAREVSRTEYEYIASAMTEADKAGLVKSAQLLDKEIAAARLDREYSLLKNFGEQAKGLTEERMRIASAGKGTPGELARAREIDKQLQLLEKEANATINEISKAQGIQPSSVRTVYDTAKEVVTPPPFNPTASTAAVRFGNRSLMPQTKAKVPQGWTRESDLVYMEQHATDPNKVVMYYTDDAGRAVTAREVSRAEYERIASAMTEADKAGLTQSAQHFKKEIAAARLDREYGRLESLGKQVKGLTEERMRITSAGKGTPGELARAREIDKQLQLLEKEANVTINEIAKVQGIQPSSVRTTYNTAKEVVTPPSFNPTASTAAVRFGERSLMPTSKTKVPQGWTRESDLVYMEQHATDPNKVVMYYTDDAGRAVTAREVSRAEYERIASAMTEADKAGLTQSAQHFKKEIAAARLDREYGRLENLGERIKDLRNQLQDINSSPVEFVLGEGNRIQRGSRVRKEIAALEAEANGVINDIAKASNTKQETVRAIFNASMETAPAPKTAAAKPYYSLRERDLFAEYAPSRPQKGPADPRTDGIVALERHATDPDVTIVYMEDANGNIRASQWYASEAEKFIAQLSDAEKVQLARLGQENASALQSLRAERAFNDLEKIGQRLKALRAQKESLQNANAPFKQVKAVSDQIRRQEELAKMLANDMIRNGLGSEYSIGLTLQSAQESAMQATKTFQPQAMRNRSLMPQTNAKVPQGWTRKSDLVYMEQHATDPNKVVMYYTDDAGRAVTAREVSRAEYERIASAMTEADKAGLTQSAQHFKKEIAAARLEREYLRLETLGRELETVSAQLQELNKTQGFAKEGALLNTRYNELQKELSAVVKDIARESQTPDRTVWQMFRNWFPNVGRRAA